MKSPLLRAACACAVTFCVASAQAETLLVTQDTYANGINPNNNYGSNTLLNVRDYGPTNSFIEFDVSSISGSTVESATLEIDVVTVKAGGTLDVRLVDAAWSENTLTFNNQPGFGGPQGNIPVANGDAGGTASVDVTSIVQGWADGTIANYGLALTSSSINVRLGSKEGNAPAKLQVITTGISTRTSVNVPKEFDTIQAAIDNISVTWCPAEALRCAIIVAPGAFDGFTFELYETPQPQTVSIVGAGRNATVIGSVRTLPSTLNANTIPELRNLTIEEDGTSPSAVYSSESHLFVIEDVTVSGTISLIGSEFIFSNITLSNVKAQRVALDENSRMDVTGSDISVATADEASIRAKYSSFGDLFMDTESSGNIAFCSADDVRVLASKASIVNSSIRLLSVGGARLQVGNSIVDRVVDEGGNFLLQCQFVIDENFGAYQPDCTLPAP